MKISKKTFSTFFIYNIIFIVIFLIASYAIMFLINFNLYKIREDEKISIFVEGFSYNDETLVDEYERRLIEETKNNEHPILELDFYLYSSTDSNFLTYYQQFGLSSDFLILSKESIDVLNEEDLLDDSFLALNNDFLEDINATSYERYVVENEIYGLKVYDHLDENYNDSIGFNKLINFNQYDLDFYLVFNMYSVNLNDYIKEGITNNVIYAYNLLISLLGE